MTKIVGVSLVKNEENFIAWALMNVVDFFDEILVMDNLSEDNTRKIVDSLASEHKNIKVIQVRRANRTHNHIENFVGTPTWILKIDGDEILDPSGLAQLLNQILKGQYDSHCLIEASAVNVLGFDFSESRVFGYSQPNTLSSLLLYNMNSIAGWHNTRSERLHPIRKIVLKPRYSRIETYQFWKNYSWDNSLFRGLHLCFFPRSFLVDSLNDNSFYNSRDNFTDMELGRIIRRMVSRNYPNWKLREIHRKMNKLRRHESERSIINLCQR